MFPSNNSQNGNDPISYSDQAFCCRPFTFDFDNNPTSIKESNLDPPPLSPPFSFFHFPSPFEDNEIFLEQHHDFLLQFHHLPLAEPEPEPVVNMEVSVNTTIPGKGGNCITTEKIPRKRSSKRDRHSKIITARGLKDRRMRLSLEVAKRFFGLQDMLGFVKASKTVEWLLNQAQVEIDQLAREKNHSICISAGAKSASSTSECEGVSGLDEVAVSGNQEQEGEPPAVKRRIKHSRRSTFHPLSREYRERARERARERTKEKMKSRRQANESKQFREAANHNLSQLVSWNPFETGEESGTQSQSGNPTLDVLTEAEERSSHVKEHLETVEDMANVDSLAIISKWSPPMIFNSLNNSELLEEHQFADFQSLGKPWEHYNKHT